MALSVQEFKKEFDAHLQKELEVLRQHYQERAHNSFMRSLISHTFDLVEHGGKRIRPYMMYLTFQTEGYDEMHWSALIGLEIFHTFALIHDDIIDKATHRRSLPTLQHVSRENRKMQSVDSIDEAYALLLGDLLFSISTSLLIRDVPDAKVREVVRIFHEMIDVVVMGQSIDVSFMHEKTVSAEDIAKKNYLKTSSYTFIYPMILALSLVNDKRHSADTYSEIGRHLGEAFQVRDDVMNCTLDVAVTGKTPFTDIEDGQHTCITQYIFKHKNNAYKDILRKYFGSDLSAENKEELKKLVHDSGAIEYAKGKIQKSCDQARTAINLLEADEEVKKSWYDCVSLIEKHV